jgi:hypothetical protein
VDIDVQARQADVDMSLGSGLSQKKVPGKRHRRTRTCTVHALWIRTWQGDLACPESKYYIEN